MPPQPSQAAVRVLLVDDDPDLLEGLSTWLESFDYEVIVARDGQEAIGLLRRKAIDVVVTDLKMPRVDGLNLLGLIKDLDPAIQVIFLSGQATLEDAIDALREGRAFDFLKKPLEDPQQLNMAIERALSRRLRQQAEPVPAPVSGLQDPLIQRLNERERDILLRIMEGRSHREIAEQVGLTEKTVRNYLSLAYEKLEVSNLAQAIVYCHKVGFAPTP